MRAAPLAAAAASSEEIKALATAAVPLSELRQDNFRMLREAIGPSVRVVAIGEETHGTEDFYRLRAEITQSLIEHEGFTAVLCEADFPPMYELNRYVEGTHKIRKQERTESDYAQSKKKTFLPPGRCSDSYGGPEGALPCVDVVQLRPERLCGVAQRLQQQEKAEWTRPRATCGPART